ncbi:M23 family metallopeptidase [Geopsychrobacter electrodiphilus]|uniref:M23 family metallopeptidase n=1 Tax=Geopsychrobacter electrodiphilus TaxID=225196 RepID=UPI00036A5216|nr:M23 family metallopeptidase [Geopsychrobacter electrodiphilus]
MKSLKKLLLILIVIGLFAAAFTYFRDTAAPLVQLTPGTGPVSNTTPLKLNLSDEGTGLKSLKVEAVQGDKHLLLLSQEFPPQTLNAQIDLLLGDKKLGEGPVTIEVTSGDRSIYHLGKGNSEKVSFNLTYDSRAPIISVLSRTHNFRHGGSGLVIYRLNEEVKTSGLMIGDHFFPGFKQASGNYIVLGCWPWNLKEADFVPRVVARDLAGNERQAGIYYHTIEEKFRHRQINLPDSFLQQKAPEFESLAPGLSDPLEIFLKVNRDVRADNRQKLVELSHNTSPVALWKGAFTRQPGASTLASFADARDYIYHGKKIDHATHLGFDLASVAHAKVIAANSGTVVFADYLGIYGQCVVIDHGLGLQTLYAHMSQLDVTVGDQVHSDQPIGRSGSTGMAGGDHLHFGVFISGIAVQPLEWWDASWVKNNITSKLVQP